MQEILNLHAQSSWVSVTAKPHRQTTSPQRGHPHHTAGSIHSDGHKEMLRVFWYLASGICIFFARPAEKAPLSTSVQDSSRPAILPCHIHCCHHTRCFLLSGFRVRRRAAWPHPQSTAQHLRRDRRGLPRSTRVPAGRTSLPGTRTVAVFAEKNQQTAARRQDSPEGLRPPPP